MTAGLQELAAIVAANTGVVGALFGVYASRKRKELLAAETIAADAQRALEQERQQSGLLQIVQKMDARISMLEGALTDANARASEAVRIAQKTGDALRTQEVEARRMRWNFENTQSELQTTRERVRELEITNERQGIEISRLHVDLDAAKAREIKLAKELAHPWGPPTEEPRIAR